MNPPDKFSQQTAAVAHPDQGALQVARWSGAMPHPDDLLRYSEILPGAPERFMQLVEREAAQRHQLEKLNVQEIRRGQWLGFLTIILVLGVAVISMFMGAHPAVTIALVGLPVAGMIRSLLATHKKLD